MSEDISSKVKKIVAEHLGIDEAKVLGYDKQFVHVCRISDGHIMKDYI